MATETTEAYSTQSGAVEWSLKAGMNTNKKGKIKQMICTMAIIMKTILLGKPDMKFFEKPSQTSLAFLYIRQ